MLKAVISVFSGIDRLTRSLSWSWYDLPSNTSPLLLIDGREYHLRYGHKCGGCSRFSIFCASSSNHSECVYLHDGCLRLSWSSWEFEVTQVETPNLPRRQQITVVLLLDVLAKSRPHQCCLISRGPGFSSHAGLLPSRQLALASALGKPPI
jgi:hypothetical protein